MVSSTDVTLAYCRRCHKNSRRKSYRCPKFDGDSKQILEIRVQRKRNNRSKNMFGIRGEAANPTICYVFFPTECIGILKRKVSGIFWGNLNFPAIVTWSEKFRGFFGGT